MAKQPGRKFVLKQGTTVIAGGKTVGMTVNGSPINVEDQGDEGFATFLAGELVERSLEMSVEGYVDSTVLRVAALSTAAVSPSFFDDLSFEFPDTGAITGDFVMTAYTETGEFRDGQAFTATFTSDGKWAYAAPSA